MAGLGTFSPAKLKLFFGFLLLLAPNLNVVPRETMTLPVVASSGKARYYF